MNLPWNPAPNAATRSATDPPIKPNDIGSLRPILSLINPDAIWVKPFMNE